MRALIKESFIKYMLLLLLSISVLHAETIKSDEHLTADICIGAQDVVLLKKVYNFGEYKVELKRYKLAWKEMNYKKNLDDYEVYYIFTVFKKGIKKALAVYRNDFIEMMDTPYKFPYVVMHESNLNEYNGIILLDFSDGFRVVQSMEHTRINYDRLKNRMSPFLWKEKNSHLFSSYSNPIMLGDGGTYYMENYEPVGYAKCNACQKYEKVLYKFDGKRFQKYKTFVWDENTTQRINESIWGEGR